MHRHPARRLPGDRDGLRIAAERGDILLDPLQGGDLIQKPTVARDAVTRLLGQLGMHVEAKQTQAVIDVHHH